MTRISESQYQALRKHLEKRLAGLKVTRMVLKVNPKMAKAMRKDRRKRKRAREYQRAYYAKNRTKILQQRKQRTQQER